MILIFLFEKFSFIKYFISIIYIKNIKLEYVNSFINLKSKPKYLNTL